MLDINDISWQIVRDFDWLISSEIVKRGSPLLIGDCIIEVGVNVVDIGLNIVYFGGVNEVAIDDCLLIDVLNSVNDTQRLTIPRLSPLMARELLQKRALIASP